MLIIHRHHATERRKLCSRFTTGADFMDLNYLYQRYAVSLQMSENAACDSSRIVHRKLAEAYADRLHRRESMARWPGLMAPLDLPQRSRRRLEGASRLLPQAGEAGEYIGRVKRIEQGCGIFRFRRPPDRPHERTPMIFGAPGIIERAFQLAALLANVDEHQGAFAQGRLCKCRRASGGPENSLGADQIHQATGPGVSHETWAA